MRKLSIVREGKIYSFLLILLAAASYGYSSLLGLIFVFSAGFMLYFFRDPERSIPSGGNLVLSPADGRVMRIGGVEHPFLGGRGRVVSIFLSPFDVHINRSPISGRVGFMEYIRGSKYPAYFKRASEENESNLIGIDGGDIKVMVKQIAGVFARRIVVWVSEGDTVERGGKLGMIRFGSRTEVFVPDSVSLKVSVGDKVKAGESIVGEIRND